MVGFVIYAPTDHRKMQEFLTELFTVFSTFPYPLVVARYFNLIRGSEDKNNANIN
jgi:hypothetical protein